jgi:hypothetical protein
MDKKILVLFVLVAVAFGVSEAGYCVHKPYEFCETKFDEPETRFATRFWDYWQCQARPLPASPGSPCYDTTPLKDLLTGNPSAPSFPKQQPHTQWNAVPSQPQSPSNPFMNQWGRYQHFATDPQDMRRTAQLLKPSTENWGQVGHIAAFETGDGRPFVINHGMLAFRRDPGAGVLNDAAGLGGWQLPGPSFKPNQPRPYTDGLNDKTNTQEPNFGNINTRGTVPSPNDRHDGPYRQRVADWWRFKRPELVVEELSRDARWTVCLSPDCSSARPPVSFTQDGELATYFNFAPCGLSSSVHLWVDGQKRLTFVGVSSRTAWTDPRVVFAQCVDAACSEVRVRALGQTFRNLPAVEHQCVGGHFGVGARIVVASDGNPSIMWRNKNNPADIVYLHCRDAECKDIAPPQTFQLDAEKVNPAIHPRAEADEWLSAAQGGTDDNGWQLPGDGFGAVGRDNSPFPARNQWQWSSALFYEPALWWDLVASERGVWMVTLHQANRAHGDGATFMQVTPCDDTHCHTSGEQYPSPDVPDTNGSPSDGLRNTANVRSRESASYDYFYGADRDLDAGFQDFKRSFWRNHGWSWSTNAFDESRGKFAGSEDEWQGNSNNLYPPEAMNRDVDDTRSGQVNAAAWSNTDALGHDLANVGSQWTQLWGRSYKPTVGDVAWASRAFSAGLTGDGYPMWVGQAESGPESSIAWMVCSCRSAECREPECHVLANGDSIMDPAMRQCLTYRQADLRSRSFGAHTGTDDVLEHFVDDGYQLGLGVSRPADVTDPRWQRAAHHASRHRILNGASDGLPIIVQQISSFCLELDGDGFSDPNAYSGWLGGGDLRGLAPGHAAYSRSRRYFAPSVTNRRVVLQSAKSVYINCLDATCKQASVSALETPKAASVSTELGYQQVDSTLVAPDNILTIYAPDQTFHELTYSWMDPHQPGAPFGDLMRDDFARGAAAFSAPGTITTSINGLTALPMYAFAREVLGLSPTPRTAGWKTWLTNRWSSPNGSPCDARQAGRMVSADDVVFLCTGLDLGDDQRYGTSLVDGWTNFWEWQELGWGLRWRWLGDVHYGTDRPMSGLAPRLRSQVKPEPSQNVLRRMGIASNDDSDDLRIIGTGAGLAWNTANNWNFGPSSSTFSWNGPLPNNDTAQAFLANAAPLSAQTVSAPYTPATPITAQFQQPVNMVHAWGLGGPPAPPQAASCAADFVEREIFETQWYVTEDLEVGTYTIDVASHSGLGTGYMYALMYPCAEFVCTPAFIIAEGCTEKSTAEFVITPEIQATSGGIYYLAIGNRGESQAPPFTARGGLSQFSPSVGRSVSAVIGPSNAINRNPPNLPFQTIT